MIPRCRWWPIGARMPTIPTIGSRSPCAGIAWARLVVFTVSGTSKAGVPFPPVAGADLPAARVTAEQVLWLVDADAGEGTTCPPAPRSSGRRKALLR